jgi:Ni/Fe-hydrogenase subunit HybB-like protein
MEPLIHAAPYTGWVFPNETVFEWSLLLAVYPYLTGLVAGAFTVSSMYQVFKFERFKPVAHFALLTSFCCMLFVPTPLLLHLGHPERAMNPMITPHFTSAMAMFGFFATFYLLLLTLEIWFAYRPYIVEQAQKRADALGQVYKLLTLGSYDVSEKALAHDRKWVFWLAVTGIPGAHGLHGYVGFLFGSVKAREWWSSDLMPVIFLFSAIISGVSMLIVLYVISCKVRKIEVDLACLKGLTYTVWAFIMVALMLEGLEYANIVYKAREGVDMIQEYLSTRAFYPYFILQFAVGSIFPMLLWSLMIWWGTTGKPLIYGTTLGAVLVMFSVFMMRWNVVIGGQEISKTAKGLLTYEPVIFGQEGILMAAFLCLVPFAVLLVMIKIFPPWEHHDEKYPAAS